MTLTDVQIKQAQEAGNEAWEAVPPYLPGDQYHAYRAAYDASIAAAIELFTRSADAIEALDHAADQVGVTAAWLTPREVAMLEARTAECSGITDEYSSSTEGHW